MKRTALIMMVFFLICSSIAYGEETEALETHTETAIVLEASKVDDVEQSEELVEQIQQVKLKITSGEYKDQVFEIENNLSGNAAYDIPVEKGDKILVGIEKLEDGGIEVFIVQYMRQNYIFYLCGLFILLLIIVGKKKGIKAVVTLAITVVAVLKILLPLMLKGKSPVVTTILVSIGITIFTLFVVSGVNNKSISAIIGTSSGVLIAGFIVYLIGNRAKLTGFTSEEAVMLMYIPQEVKFDFKGILFSGIIMGALGAVMDVAMSISSAMDEIYNANEDLTREELFSAGMNVGKDVMGTMTNTLILAYTGSSIPLLLLFMAYNASMKEILNLDIIATEVIRSLAGSIGLVLTIPLTAFVASFLMKKDKN